MQGHLSSLNFLGICASGWNIRGAYSRNRMSSYLNLFLLDLLEFLTVIDYRFGVSRFVTFVTAVSWQWYANRRLNQVKFVTLHSCPSLTGQTASMLLEEWPSPVGNHGNPERNFVRTSSLYESSDDLPCHLVAVRETSDGQTEVVAHAMISSNTSYHFQDRDKYINMLQKGVPLDSVKKSAELAGVDSGFLDDPDVRNVSLKRGSLVQEASLASLLVRPEYRGHGLGKGMCAYAVSISQKLGIKRLVGGCSDKLVPFYEKMGVYRRKGTKRKDMPSVRLGNQMYVDFNFHILEKAKNVASKCSYHFDISN